MTDAKGSWWGYALPLVLALSVLFIVGANSPWATLASVIVSLALFALMIRSIRQGLDAAESDVDASELTHWFAGEVVHVHVDAVGRVWLRVEDVCRILGIGLSPAALAERHPRGIVRANPRLAAWYLTPKTLAYLVSRQRNAQASRFLAWVEREILGNRRPDFSPEPVSPPEPETRAGHWFARHWRGEVGLLPAALGGAVVVVAVIVLSFAGIDGGDITRSYQRHAWRVILGTVAVVAAVYWWGRGVLLAAWQASLSRRARWGPLLAAGAGFMAIGLALKVAVSRHEHFELTEYMAMATDTDQKPEVSVDALGETISMEGRMGFGTTERIRAALAANPNVRRIELTSFGGRVAEGQALLLEIESHRLDTVVDQYCVSACTSAFIGGQARIVSDTAFLGFHRAGFHWLADSGQLSSTDLQKMANLRARGVSEDFIRKALEPSIHGVFSPTMEEALVAGVVTEIREGKLY